MTPSLESKSYIFCNVGREAYAIEASRILSVEKPHRLQHEHATSPKTQIGSHPGPMGDMPLYSLSRLLGRRDAKPGGEAQRVITLISNNNEYWALLVHSLSPIIDVAHHRITPLPAIVQTADTGIFPSVIQHKGHLILVLSLDQLFPSKPLDEPVLSEHDAPLNDAGAVSLPFSGMNLIGAADEAALLALRATPPQEYSGTLVLFYLPDQLVEQPGIAFGLSMAQVAEIYSIPAVIPVPKGPAAVLGLSLWRDNVLPIVDLNQCLGLSSSSYLPSDGESQLIVARGPEPGQLIGFPIQAGVRALNTPIKCESYRPHLPLDQALTRGIYTLSTDTLVVPDLRRLMSQDPLRGQTMATV